MNAAARLAALAIALLPAMGLAQGVTTARAIFATGCFWCTESDFEKLEGVQAVVSGYVGGQLDHPTYEQVSGGQSGHAEAVEIVYDPARISYERLLEHFWRTHDPFDGDGQFCDQGAQYRPAIFYRDEAQKAAAESSRAQQQKRFVQPILTHIEPAGRFWPAEAYHQDYYKNHPLQYRYYRARCGRDARVQAVWGAARP